jgi:hypothetical protein
VQAAEVPCGRLLMSQPSDPLPPQSGLISCTSCQHLDGSGTILDTTALDHPRQALEIAREQPLVNLKVQVRNGHGVVKKSATPLLHVDLREARRQSGGLLLVESPNKNPGADALPP